MGCDIHWYSETFHEGKWCCDQEDSFDSCEVSKDGFPDMAYFPNSHRDYWLFGTLAGVRYGFLWSEEPKGFPYDASDEVRQIYERWDCYSHTPSYLTRAELKEIIERVRLSAAQQLINPQEQIGLNVANHCLKRLHEIVGNLNDLVPDEHQRIVFWFDN